MATVNDMYWEIIIESIDVGMNVKLSCEFYIKLTLWSQKSRLWELIPSCGRSSYIPFKTNRSVYNRKNDRLNFFSLS